MVYAANKFDWASERHISCIGKQFYVTIAQLHEFITTINTQIDDTAEKL